MCLGQDSGKIRFRSLLQRVNVKIKENSFFFSEFGAFSQQLIVPDVSGGPALSSPRLHPGLPEWASTLLLQWQSVQGLWQHGPPPQWPRWDVGQPLPAADQQHHLQPQGSGPRYPHWLPGLPLIYSTRKSEQN